MPEIRPASMVSRDYVRGLSPWQIAQTKRENYQEDLAAVLVRDNITGQLADLISATTIEELSSMMPSDIPLECSSLTERFEKWQENALSTF